jgi:hypothetical protein
MIYAFIRSWIGSFGRALMDFYIQNSLWINALILGYALLVVVSHRNYFNALEKILLHLRFNNQKFSREGISKLTTNDYRMIDWDEVKKSIKFPLVSEPKSWGVKAINQSYLSQEFTMEKLNEFIKTAKKQKES